MCVFLLNKQSVVYETIASLVFKVMPDRQSLYKKEHLKFKKNVYIY